MAWTRLTFEIPLYKDGTQDETISGLKAVTYNLENGKIVETKAKSDGFFNEKFSDNLTLVKVALPNVKVGSVVEITYKINSDFLMNFWDWEFQETIPVVWSEYRASIPEFFNYDKYMQGYIPLDIADEKVAPNSISITSKERSVEEDGVLHKPTFPQTKLTLVRTSLDGLPKTSPPSKRNHSSRPIKITFRK